MIDIDRLRQLAQATNEHSDDRVKILAEFYAATESDTIIELLDRIEAVEKERDALRAKVEQMERQEPVAHVWRCDNGHIHGSCEREIPMGQPLYLAPYAQPEPSVPEGWKLVPVVSTAEMDNAGADHCDGHWDTAQVVWDAMLAAAPEAKL